MTNTTKTDNWKPIYEDYYFWLGAEGDLIPCTEEEFTENQERLRKQHEDWFKANV